MACLVRIGDVFVSDEPNFLSVIDAYALPGAGHVDLHGGVELIPFDKYRNFH